MANVKSTAFTEDTTPSGSDNIFIGDPSTGAWKRLTVAQFLAALPSALEVPQITIGAGNMGRDLHIIKTIVGQVRAQIQNQDAGATSNSILSIYATGGDPFIHLVPSDLSAGEWTIGIDNSDGDKLKIGSSFDIGTDTALTIDHNFNITLSDLAGAGTEDVQADSNGMLVRITSDESTKKDFVVGEGVPGLDFVLQLAQATMSFKYKNEALNAELPYLGFSANKAHELVGDNVIFRKYAKPIPLPRDEDGKPIGVQKYEAETFGFDQKNLIAPLYKAIEDQQKLINDLTTRIEALEG